jgi:hypothetical protein
VLEEPGTSVLVTYMSAQEQKRIEQRMASKGFIMISPSSAAAGFTTYHDGYFFDK